MQIFLEALYSLFCSKSVTLPAATNIDLVATFLRYLELLEYTYVHKKCGHGIEAVVKYTYIHGMIWNTCQAIKDKKIHLLNICVQWTRVCKYKLHVLDKEYMPIELKFEFVYHTCECVFTYTWNKGLKCKSGFDNLRTNV